MFTVHSNEIWFHIFQFEDEGNAVIIDKINLDKPKMSNDTNKFIIKPFQLYQHPNDSGKFGIQISFEWNAEGINGILINYHLMCATLVLVATVNFLIDPKIVPGRAGLLVTLFLVLANFFSCAQVTKINTCTYLWRLSLNGPF